MALYRRRHIKYERLIRKRHEAGEKLYGMLYTQLEKHPRDILIKKLSAHFIRKASRFRKGSVI